MPKIPSKTPKPPITQPAPIQKLEPGELPDTLKPYKFLGLTFTYKPNQKDVVAECPWCGANKFSILIENGVWQCWKCSFGKGHGGNAVSFVRKLHEIAVAQTTRSQLEVLAKTRNIMDAVSLSDWGVAVNPLNRDWIAPGFNGDSKLCTLYRYVNIKDDEGNWKRRWFPTPMLGQHALGLQLFNPRAQIINVCEGLFDSVTLWEMLNVVSMGEGLKPHDGEGRTLADDQCVIGVPGTKIFLDSWLHLFGGKVVNLFFDNDKPKRDKQGTLIPSSGLEGMKRAAGKLYKSKNPPLQINYVNWGPDGYDPSYSDGFDMSDTMNIAPF